MIPGSRSKRSRPIPSRESRRRLAVLLCGVLGALAACGEALQGPASEPETPAPGEIPGPRAIVLISLDTLRADRLGIYGHERFTSPVLDQFASEGVVFDDASAPSPWTLPSHASMLTGLVPLRHGLASSEEALSPEVETLAEWFSRAGWQTSAIVNSLYLHREIHGLTRDFEDYVSVKRHYAYAQPSTRITEEAMARIAQQGERPLFLFLHYYDLHADYTSLPAYENLFVSPYEGVADGSSWQLRRANFSDEHIELCVGDPTADKCEYGKREEGLWIDGSMERVSFEPADILHLEELYDASLRQTDTEVGRFLSYLSELGRSEDTVVVVTSDHGEEFHEHGRVDHFLTMYQESLRVPLLARGPGIPSGLRFAELVSLIDLPATLLTLGGVPVPAGLDGVDLSRLWREPGSLDLSRRVLYGEASGGLEYHRWFPGLYPIYRSARRGDFKLVERTDRGAISYQLHDLARDPEEARDVSGQNPALVAQLQALLEGRPRGDAGPPPETPVEISGQEAEQLRALGYVP